jgi:hypothetical protein
VPPVLQQALHVVGRHQHVAVGEDNPIAAGRAPAFDEIVELGIGGDRMIADE